MRLRRTPASPRRVFEVGAEDALIAATADLSAMTVLTANARHFMPMGVRWVDPRAGLPPDIGP